MSTPAPGTLPIAQQRFGLLARFLIVFGVLAVETLLVSGLIQDPLLDELTGAARLVHHIQHWAFCFLVAYAGSFAILLYLRGSENLAALSRLLWMRRRTCAGHAASVLTGSRGGTDE